jgi:hypothetical protein
VNDHRVVSHDDSIEARKELLAKEKEFTRLRDEMTSRQRALPWEEVEKTVASSIRTRRTLAASTSSTPPTTTSTSCRKAATKIRPVRTLAAGCAGMTNTTADRRSAPLAGLDQNGGLGEAV